MQLSARTQQLKPSATLVISAKATELASEGKRIVKLSAGEPDFKTPEHIQAAAIQAIKEGQHGYTAVDGTPAIKAAIAEKFERENALSYQAEEIIVSCGAKHSLYTLFQAILNPGDEVLIPAPYWVSYPEMAKLADAVPVIVETTAETQFKLTADLLTQAITPKTRLLILNSPSNPTGMMYRDAELAALAEVLRKHPNIAIVSDDIYEHIQWTGQPFHNIVNIAPDLRDRTIVINGVSKAYAMTGWRIGYAAGPTPIIRTMKKIQGQSTSNPCSISQAATVAALTGDQSCITTMREAFKARHDFVVERLQAINGIRILPVDGTFYLLPSITNFLRDGQTDVAFCESLLTTAGVALVPGSAFGAPGHVRLSFASSREALDEALTKFERFVSTQRT